MIFPSKFSPLDDSILAKIRHLMIEGVDEIPISELMKMKIKNFDDAGEFILALDMLYTLGKIDLDVDRRIIRYVS